MPPRLNTGAVRALMMAAGLEPLDAYPGAGNAWRCRCVTCGAEVAPRYNSVRAGRADCIHCSRKATSGASQRLPHEAAVALMVENNLKPLEPYRNSSGPWRCRCLTCGAEVAPRYSNIKQGWGGCWTCRSSAQSVWQRQPENLAIDTMRAAGVEPLEPFRSNRTPWRSKCLTCSCITSPTLSSVQRGQGACKYCAGCAILPEEAVAYMRLAGVEPLSAYPGRHAPWRCRCSSCQREVTPQYGSIRRGQGGCHWCSQRGFDATKAAVVYLLSHYELGAAKIGITAVDSSRLKVHNSFGWELLAQFQVPGNIAMFIEHEILNWWRCNLDLPPYLSREDMPQGGWTETVELDELDVAATTARMRMLAIDVGVAHSGLAN